MKLPESPVALLQELIRIPSVNPDGARDVDAAGEKACAEYVGDFLSSCGAEVVYEEVLPGRPNVIGRFSGDDGKPGLLFAPHTDTVSVLGMTVDPFGGELSQGKVYGRGASDTKGTMAAMLWALHSMRDRLPHLSHRVAFVGFMGEEAGQPGSIHFARRHAAEFDFAVVGEPTSLKTVHAHKGCVWLELSTEGRSCHGSTPDRGKNAAVAMLGILPPLLEALRDRLPSFADPVLGPATVSLGTLSAGTSPNIVPDRCSAVLDFRETPALHAAGGCRALVGEILESIRAEESVLVSTLGESVPLLTPIETDGVQRLCSIGSEPTTAPWFCDAGRLGEEGLAAVAVGPGDIAQAHTKDEFLAVADLEEGVDFYVRFLETYG